MRPWLIVSADFLKTGGQDRANFALASWLARRGDEVHLVAHRVDDDLAAASNITVHPAPKPLNSGYLGEPFLGRRGTRWARDLAPRGARVVVNGGNCDWPDANWVHYVHAAHERRTRGSVLRRARMRLAHRRSLAGERRALRAARCIIANSQRTMRDLVERVGVPQSRVRVIYYGIDAEQFRPANCDKRRATRASIGWPIDRPVVLFVGALGDQRKGFDTLFDAWKILHRDRQWDADLFVIGQGAQVPMWTARIADAGLSERIHFLGFRDDVPRIMRAADVLVSPTRYEAYGLGVHEAICCGLQAIVSADAGVAERYPPELRDLLLPDPNDADDLARRLKAALEHRPPRTCAIEQFASRLRSRSWDDMAAEIAAAVEAGQT